MTSCWTAGVFTLICVHTAAADVVRMVDKQPMPLQVDVTHVAIYQPTRNTTLAADDTIDRLGLERSNDYGWQRSSWTMVRTPVELRGEQALRGWIDTLSSQPGLGFVSPVLVDEYGPQVIKPHILVGFRRDLSARRAERTLGQLGAGIIMARDWGGMPLTYRIDPNLANGFDVLERANQIAQHPDVMWATPSRTFTVQLADTIPNDPLFPAMWHLHSTGQAGAIVDHDLDMPEAWDIEQGSIQVVVAVLDVGVQQDHPDIYQVVGHDFTGQGTWGGGPGNACDNHGTGVAGAITGIMNNLTLGTGVAPGCLVASARVAVANVPCDGAATGDTDDIVDALQWVQNQGFDITNMSLGFPADSAVSQKIWDTHNAGITHFAATGNEGNSTIYYPASSDAVIAVTGITRTGAPYGNYGFGVSICAPAEGILTTDRTGAAGGSPNDWRVVGGTSIASPIAAGVGALLKALDGSMTPADIQFILETTAIDQGQPGYDTTYGFGMVNAYNALLAQMVQTCGAGEPSCLTVNSGVGCNNIQCCLAVCDLDSFCCLTQWDNLCAQLASDLCTSCGELGAGSCFLANGSAACEDDACCQTVCLIDPFCCETSWDNLCVQTAQAMCAASNDDCADAASIFSSGTFDFDTTNATTDGLSHPQCLNAGEAGIDKDVWYRFTPFTSGEVIVRTCGLTSVDTKIAVYNAGGACPPTDAMLLRCNDDSCGGGLQSQVQFSATAGTPYLIRIGVYPGASGGTGFFQIEYPNLGADLCSNATPIAGAGTYSFDNIAAQTDGPDHAACNFASESGIAKDVWFCWTAPATSTATISTCGLTDIDTKIAVYDHCGTCPPTDDDLLICNDDACASVQSRLAFNTVGGQSYLIRLGVYPGTLGGTGQFTIEHPLPAENDDCPNTAVVGEGVFLFDTTLATSDGPVLPPSCDEGAGLSFVDDIWYRYVPTCNGQATISLCGSSYDSRLAVYSEGSCPPPDEDLLACNDDGCLGTTNATLTFPVTAGQWYLLRVGGYSGGGSGILSISCACPGDLNDDGVVNVLDLLIMLGAWGNSPGHAADLTGDGVVNVLDLLQLLGRWGAC